MMDVALKNRGVIRIGAALGPGPKTIVIVGAARGGTSIFSGALHKLGVFMGERSHPPVFEDLVLSSAFESGDLPEARRIVARYDEHYSVWAFKRPGATGYLEDLHALLREPVYLFVFRDLAAIARRNLLSMRAAPIPSMRHALSAYASALDFIEDAQPRGLLVSCEKMLIHSSDVLEYIEQYLDLDAPAASRKAALEFIETDPRQYIERTRLEFSGRIDAATTEAVTGWAYIRNHPAPAALTVLVNGTPVGTATARLRRPDVREEGFHPTGECGFRFRFQPDVAIRNGDEVAVRFQIGGDELERSPRRVGEA